MLAGVAVMNTEGDLVLKAVTVHLVQQNWCRAMRLIWSGYFAAEQRMKEVPQNYAKLRSCGAEDVQADDSRIASKYPEIVVVVAAAALLVLVMMDLRQRKVGLQAQVMIQLLLYCAYLLDAS